MPTVESLKPLQVAPLGGGEVKITNRGPTEVLYGETKDVSATNKLGTLTESQTLTIRGAPVFLITPAETKLAPPKTQQKKIALVELEYKQDAPNPQEIVTGPHYALDNLGNMAIGEVFPALTTGEQNVAVGLAALSSLTTSPFNTAIGVNALHSEKDGPGLLGEGYNTAVGWGALQNAVANHNTAIGAVAMQAVTTGGPRENTAVGAFSLRNNAVIGEGNTAVGTGAMESTVGTMNSCVAVGQNSLEVVEASGHVAVGMQAFKELKTGNVASVAVGFKAGSGASAATASVLIGSEAAGIVASSNSDVAIGSEALKEVTTSKENTVVGAVAMKKAATESNANTVIGALAMGLGTGAAGNVENVAVGTRALEKHTSGAKNAVVGAFAGGKNTTGSKNVLLGYKAGEVNKTGEGNIFLGNEAGKAATNPTSNTLIIANNETTPLIQGALSGTQSLGFFGHAAHAQEKVAAAATEVTTAVTLANSIRTMLINSGLMAE